MKRANPPAFPSFQEFQGISGSGRVFADKMEMLAKYVKYQEEIISDLCSRLETLERVRDEDKERDRKFKDAVNSFTLPD